MKKILLVFVLKNKNKLIEIVNNKINETHYQTILMKLTEEK